MLLSAFGAGRLVLRRCAFHSWIERLVFTLALGMGLWGLALFALGLVGALYRPVILSLTAISGLATAIYLVGAARGRLLLSLSSWKELLRPRRLLVIAAVAALIAYAGLLLLAAMYPPMHWDAIAGHLVAARHYLLEHRVAALRVGVFPLLPALNHMLFVWAMALKDDILAQMIEYTFLMLTALGLFSWGQREGRPGLGVAAAALWLSYPLVLWLGESAYVDIGATCFAFLGVYAFRVFWDKQDGAWWLLASALFGMAAGTKMPALFFVGAGGAFGFWARLRSRLTGRELIIGYGLALLVAVPWYAFIAYHTGNPVWPMFPQFTRSEWLLSTKESFEALVGGGGLPKTILNFFKLPFYLGLRPDLFFPDNNRGLSAVIALLPLAWVVAIWHRSVRWWSLWILAYTAYWFTFASFIRYWLPVLPLVGLALYEGLDWVMGRATKSVLIRNAVWLVLTILAIGYGFKSVYRDLAIKGRLPITEESRRAMLTGLLTGYGGVDYINRNAQPGDTVAIAYGYYLIYYTQPRTTHLMNRILEKDSVTSALTWSKNTKWMDSLVTGNVTWFLLQHDGITLPKEHPFDGPDGPSYELVYAGSGAYVWRRAPLPPNLSRDAERLKHDIPCLAPGAQVRDAAPVYDGYHDITQCYLIEGWAWDANQPDCPVDVSIYDGDTLLATLPANLLREDLARAGIGNGKHAFRYRPTDEVASRMRGDQPHVIRVVVANSGFALKNTPQSIHCPRIPEAPQN